MTNHPHHSKRNEHVAEPFRSIVNAIGPDMTQQAKPKTWAEMSEGEKSAIRAQAYPAIIDAQGREWKLGLIDDLEVLNAELLAALNAIKEAGRMSDQSRAKYCAEIAETAIAEAEGR